MKKIVATKSALIRISSVPRDTVQIKAWSASSLLSQKIYLKIRFQSNCQKVQVRNPSMFWPRKCIPISPEEQNNAQVSNKWHQSNPSKEKLSVRWAKRIIIYWNGIVTLDNCSNESWQWIWSDLIIGLLVCIKNGLSKWKSRIAIRLVSFN